MRTTTLSIAACFLAMATSVAHAETFAPTLTLDGSNASQNTLSVTVEIPLGSDLDTSTISGTVIPTLDINFLPTGQVSQINSIAFSGGRFNFDQTLNFSYVFGTTTLTGSGFSGTVLSPGGVSSVLGTSFNQSPHAVRIDQGILTGGGFAASVNENLASSPFQDNLSGTGTITVALNQTNFRTGQYNVTLSMPVVFTDTATAGAITADVTATGTLVASGSFTREVFALGDLNLDGAINTLDAEAYVAGLGLDLSAMTLEQAYGMGDLDGDFDNDHDDFLVFKQLYEAANPSEANLISIPEPGTALMIIATGVLALQRRRN